MSSGESLFAITDELRRAIEAGFAGVEVDGEVVDTETGEMWSPEAIEALGLAQQVKMEGCIAYDRELDLDIKRLKEARDFISSQIERKQKAKDNFRDYIKYCVELNGKPVSTIYGKASLATTESVEIIDVREIPEDCMSYKDPVPNKTLIKKYIKSGTHVPGAALVKNTHLRIR